MSGQSILNGLAMLLAFLVIIIIVKKNKDQGQNTTALQEHIITTEAPNSIFYEELRQILVVGRTSDEDRIETINLETNLSCRVSTNIPDSVQLQIGGVNTDGLIQVCSTDVCYVYNLTKWLKFQNKFNSVFGDAVASLSVQQMVHGLYDQGWNDVNFSLPLTVNLACMIRLNKTAVLITGGSNQGRNTIIVNWDNSSASMAFGPWLGFPRFGHVCGRVRLSPNSTEFVLIVAGGNYRSYYSEVIPDGMQAVWIIGPGYNESMYRGTSIQDPSGSLIVVDNIRIHLIRSIFDGWVLLNLTLQSARVYPLGFFISENITLC